MAKYIFLSKPKEKNSIKLNLSPCDKNIKLPLHIFQELLMTFSDGIQLLFKKNNQNFTISNLSKDNIILLNQYFQSFGFIFTIESFTIKDYLTNMKLPNYFIDKHLIKNDTLLKDIYYESTCNYIIYRLSFNFLK